jgi:hypothetical protein
MMARTRHILSLSDGVMQQSIFKIWRSKLGGYGHLSSGGEPINVTAVDS